MKKYLFTVWAIFLGIVIGNAQGNKELTEKSGKQLEPIRTNRSQSELIRTNRSQSESIGINRISSDKL